jgi:VWFA-related protein
MLKRYVAASALVLTFLLAGPSGYPGPSVRAIAAVEQDQQKPTFTSGVELVMVDAQVVDRKGVPIAGLKPQQFQVTIDGKRRNVVSAEFIDATTGLPKGETAPAAPGGAPRAALTPGNIYVIAVDQGSFRPVNAPSVVYAARELLKQAHPTDYIGMISFPEPGVRVAPTRDRKVLEEAIPRLVGFSALKQMRQYQFSLSDAIDVAAKDTEALDRLVQRNCAGDMMCARSLEAELIETVSLLEMQAARSFHGLRQVVGAMGSVPGRKTLVVLSAGIPTGDRGGGRLYMRNDALQAGKEAAAAGVLLYTLQLTSSWLDAFSPDAPSAAQTAMREASVYGKGLDIFNGTAGGTFFEVNTGADTAINRMMREMSSYYLLGVEPQDSDRDGRVHRIQVKVDARNSHVRSRASVSIPKRSGS